MGRSEMAWVTLTLSKDLYKEVTAAKERQETASVAEFIREAVSEKIIRRR